MARVQAGGGSASAGGTLSYAQVEGVWIAAGGPPSMAALMAAISQCESGHQPGIIQQGENYQNTGWGLWQITPGNSESGIGSNYQLLDPFTNAKAAVAKYKAQGLGAWTTYTNGCYTNFVQSGVAATTSGVANEEYATVGAAPAGTTGSPSSGYTGSTSADTTSSADCLIKIPKVDLKVTSVGGECLLGKADAMKLLGGLILAGSAVLVLGGLALTASAAGKKLGIKVPAAAKAAVMVAAA